MYRKLVQTLKKTEKLRMTVMTVGLGILIVAVLGFVKGHSLIDRILRYGKLLLLIVIGGVEINGYLRFDRDLAEMKRVAGAMSDFDMDQVLERCVNLDDVYFFSEEFILNFVMRNAYYRSEIKRLENYEDVHTDSDGGVDRREYCIRIYYGEKGEDRMQFSSLEKRNAARKLLEG